MQPPSPPKATRPHLSKYILLFQLFSLAVWKAVRQGGPAVSSRPVFVLLLEALPTCVISMATECLPAAECSAAAAPTALSPTYRLASLLFLHHLDLQAKSSSVRTTTHTHLYPSCDYCYCPPPLPTALSPAKHHFSHKSRRFVILCIFFVLLLSSMLYLLIVSNDDDFMVFMQCSASLLPLPPPPNQRAV